MARHRFANPSVLATASLLLLLGCNGTASLRAGNGSARPGPVDPDAPLETRPRNAVDYEPAFAGQTRVRGLHNTYRLEVKVLTNKLNSPWAVEPLPDGRLLVTEKPGQLRIVTADGKILPPVQGVPAVRAQAQGGLLDVALDPQFASNGVIYFGYSEQMLNGNTVTFASAKLVEDAQGAHLEALHTLFRQLPVMASDRQVGSRIVFGADGKLYLALGERGVEGAVGQSQDLHSHFGKVVRINPDGTVPADNPFVGRSDAAPEVWTYGHRNIQAAALDSATGKLWTIEHGPRGGDELNLIRPGLNYGWPVITYGIDYPGPKIGDGITQKEGMEQPVYYWDPVIAPSGMMIYSGALFPEWRGSVFVGSLVGGKIVRLQMQGDRVVGEEWLLQDMPRRFRDVQQGPDGSIYVLTESGAASELFRLRPAR
jgi:glucose/arabinose dehydrogenase